DDDISACPPLLASGSTAPGSPAAEARPVAKRCSRLHRQHLVPVELGGGSTGMVGQNPQPAADRQVRQGGLAPRAPCDDAVLLVRAGNEQILEDRPLFVA